MELPQVQSIIKNNKQTFFLWLFHNKCLILSTLAVLCTSQENQVNRYAVTIASLLVQRRCFGISKYKRPHCINMASKMWTIYLLFLFYIERDQSLQIFQSLQKFKSKKKKSSPILVEMFGSLFVPGLQYGSTWGQFFKLMLKGWKFGKPDRYNMT